MISLISKSIAGVLLMTMASGTSDMLMEVLGKVQVSISGIELQYIDRALQQNELLREIYKEKGRYPEDQTAFSKFMSEAFEQKNIRDNTKDQWGTVMRYVRDNNDAGYTITSAGPDRGMDTGDDLILRRIGTKVNINVDPLEVISKDIERVRKMEIERSDEMKKMLEDLQSAAITLADQMSPDEKKALDDLLSALSVASST